MPHGPALRLQPPHSAHISEHAHTCSKTGRPIPTRHNLVTSEWCQADRRAGSSSIATSLGQLCCHTVAPVGDQRAGNVLTMVPTGPLVLDTTLVHPAGADRAAEAARPDGIAAQVREAEKVDANKKDMENGVCDCEALVHRRYSARAQSARGAS